MNKCSISVKYRNTFDSFTVLFWQLLSTSTFTVWKTEARTFITLCSTKETTPFTPLFIQQVFFEWRGPQSLLWSNCGFIKTDMLHMEKQSKHNCKKALWTVSRKRKTAALSVWLNPVKRDTYGPWRRKKHFGFPALLSINSKSIDRATPATLNLTKTDGSNLHVIPIQGNNLKVLNSERASLHETSRASERRRQDDFMSTGATDDDSNEKNEALQPYHYSPYNALLFLENGALGAVGSNGCCSKTLQVR